MEEENKNFSNEENTFDQGEVVDIESGSKEEAKPLSNDTMDELQTYVAAIEGTLTKIRSIIKEGEASSGDVSASINEVKERLAELPKDDKDDPVSGKIIEGVFDGEFMIGANGYKYNVPQNYASKSKLVEGDLLKLTIGERGNFIYKQIAPIDRDRLVGVLSKDPDTGDFFVEVDHDIYRVNLASVTYFHGEPGDEAVILKPKSTKSRWAAIENIVKS